MEAAVACVALEARQLPRLCVHDAVADQAFL